MSFAGALRTIRRADMPSMRANGLSMMLHELEVGLDPQGMANLLAYQRTLRERSVRHGNESANSQTRAAERRETGLFVVLASVRRLNEVVKVGDRPKPRRLLRLAASISVRNRRISRITRSP